ncbi:hypothetical protein [Candidatus Uabimicrobium amorphum]|uniref:Type II secretion system protein GspG C-terminal domain-containing protein n=1 Tax=Uabimicrobium amorphum TaxID=2596890 RepID=A0A5S9IRH1_UABAM|nr:hypothetical protein [Candidatus Uabimicrobium amorphum]BBM85820.1 hypothetical protein UABAM_04198 [Candidatus Uabimicrobium amorphum]
MLKYTLALFILPLFVFSQVEKKLEALKKAGIPTTLQELEDKWYPYIEGENAADLYAQAVALVSQKDLDNFHKLEQQLKNEVALNKTLSQQLQKSLRELLERNSEILALFHKATAVEKCRFPVKLTDGFTAKLPHIYKMRFCITLLTSQIIIQTEDKQTEGALHTLRDTLVLTKRLAQIPMLICVLMGETMQRMSFLGLEYLLSHQQLTHAQLDMVKDLLQKTSPDKNNNKYGFVAEMCTITGIFSQISEGNYDEDLFGKLSMKDKAELLYYRMSGKCQQDFNLYVQGIESHLKVYELASLREMRDATKAIKPLEMSGSKFSAMMAPDFRKFIYVHLENTARWRAVLTAMAIEKYRLDHKKLPQNLQALMPKYLQDIAHDSYGQKLHFDKQKQGYTVYGMGENAVPDGGVSIKEGNNLDTAFFVKR